MKNRPKIPNLRTRRRANGTLRVWWEPNDTARASGFTSVELDPDRMTWSEREAHRLNKQVKKGTPERTPSSASRTVAALIENYKGSRHFTGLAEGSKPGYRGNLNIIEQKWGHFPVREFDKPTVSTWYEANLDERGTTAAIALHRMLSILFNHAERLGWRPENSNPCTKVGAIVPKGRDRVASWAETDALIAAADELGLHAAGLAISLAVYQGQRQADILKMPLGGISEQRLIDPTTQAEFTSCVWTLTRQKRGTDGAMLIHPECLAPLQAQTARLNDDATHLILDEATGKPYDMYLFGKRFRAIRDHAAQSVPSLNKPTLQFRDLRRTFGNRARAGGASKSDVGDVLGNSAATNTQLQQIYMSPQFWTASRAIMGVQRPQDQEDKRA